MKLNPELGTYSIGMCRMVGGFQLGTPPTIFRDGTNASTASGKQFTVVRNSTGLYTVTLVAGFPIPVLPFIRCWVAQSAAPTNFAGAREVVGSWNTATRSFQIRVSLDTTGAVTDGDAGDRVSFEVYGSIIGPGVDPA